MNKQILLAYEEYLRLEKLIDSEKSNNSLMLEYIDAKIRYELLIAEYKTKNKNNFIIV